MIRLSHIYKTYAGPVHALRDVDLLIEKGEFSFITGPSGSGKSTLFKLICAFDKPTSGHIEVLGTDLNQIKQSEIPFLRRKIGVVFQDFKLLKGRTIFDNIALPLEIQKERPAVIQKRVTEVLDMVGLKFRPTSVPEQLSGGEQQRVAIARALVHRPGILIADEPTGNLDPDLSQEIMEIFKTINAQGTTVVIASHDMGLVKKFSRKNLRLKSGVLEVGASL
jgi:cell division transport system ATP-binding protein